MSEIHVQQIKANLKKLFADKIDLSDCASASAEFKEATFNTRALAAFVPLHFARITVDDAAHCVIDGTGDNGIDAIKYDAADKNLTVVQAKWRDDGRGSIQTGDLHKLLAGFKDLINLRQEKFNAKYAPHHDQVRAAVEDANTQFTVVVVTTGQEEMSKEAKSIVSDFLKEMNDPTEIVTFTHMKQGDVHSVIASDIRGLPINVEVQLFEWGMTREPYVAYYGQVAASELAKWYKDHHARLFAPNLRLFLGATDANAAMIETITKDPAFFWYFNNGVTAVCDAIKKKPLGGSSRDSGSFECLNLRVVNGAQTIGSIATGDARDQKAVSHARVPAKFISLENCPPEMALAITRATNTQNKIELRDFAALDPEQGRLADELSIDQVTYSFKSGEAAPDRKSGFDLAEATVALACSNSDPNMAVQAKREISRLWEDITKAPYKALFNDSLSGRKLWRLVQIQRSIDDALKDIPTREKLAGRDSMVPVHGNRLVAHLTFRFLDLSALNQAEFDISPLMSRAQIATTLASLLVCQVVNTRYPDSYLASLFKNRSKCEKIAEEALAQLLTKKDEIERTATTRKTKS